MRESAPPVRWGWNFCQGVFALRRRLAAEQPSSVISLDNLHSALQHQNPAARNFLEEFYENTVQKIIGPAFAVILGIVLIEFLRLTCISHEVLFLWKYSLQMFAVSVSERLEANVFEAEAAFLPFFVKFWNSCVSQSQKFPVKRLAGAWSITPAVLVALCAGMLSCGTAGHATLVINAPASVVAGAPFTATVTAMYEGHIDTVIDGPIHFTSSDPAAVLPTLYVFTTADAGSHTFTGLLLNTPGNQTMTVSDYDATPIAGTVNIVVTAAGDAAKSAAKSEEAQERE
jgi:hypothetical protein